MLFSKGECSFCAQRWHVGARMQDMRDPAVNAAISRKHGRVGAIHQHKIKTADERWPQPLVDAAGRNDIESMQIDGSPASRAPRGQPGDRCSETTSCNDPFRPAPPRQTQSVPCGCNQKQRQRLHPALLYLRLRGCISSASGRPTQRKPPNRLQRLKQMLVDLLHAAKQRRKIARHQHGPWRWTTAIRHHVDTSSQ